MSLVHIDILKQIPRNARYVQTGVEAYRTSVFGEEALRNIHCCNSWRPCRISQASSMISFNDLLAFWPFVTEIKGPCGTCSCRNWATGNTEGFYDLPCFRKMERSTSMILQIKQTLSTWLVLFAASLCFIFCFPLLQWNTIFPCFKFGQTLAGTGVYQKDLRVFGAKVGRLSVQRFFMFFLPRVPLLIGGYTTLEWRWWRTLMDLIEALHVGS